jgi:C1A family cysteine protease
MFAVKPSEKAFIEALDHQVLKYERLPQKKEYIMDAIYRGYPVIYGKLIYESFMSEKVARTGIVPYPRKCWEDFIGGHAMVIFDYDKDYTVEPNSWGKDWGFNGVCKVPWTYVLDSKLSFDFWVMYVVEG